MNRGTRRLLALNLGLAIALGVVTLAAATRSGAQPGNAGNTRARGEYAMVSGKFQGSSSSAVYIVDAVNQDLVALDWDRNKNRFEVIGYRSLTADAELFRGAR